MADALASGASGGNTVEVQVLSTAPSMRLWRNWQTRYFEGVVFTRRMGSSPINRTTLSILGRSSANNYISRSWRNWQTRYFEGVVFTRRMGSSPIDRTTWMNCSACCRAFLV